MKRLYIAALAGVSLLLGLAYWKNRVSYSYKPVWWRAVKSVVDCALVILSALYMPALLVAWTVGWLTRGVARRGVQITLAVLIGIALGSISGIFLELLCILGIFSVDLLTGAQGIYGWYNQSIPTDFMVSLRDHEWDANT